MNYDVFISYSRKDYMDENKNVIPGNEVSKIKEALTKAGITFWMDEKGIMPGDDYAAMIVKYIKACKVFVYISSEAANESEWTRKEISCALMYKKHLVPLLLDDSPFHDSVILRIADLDRIDYYINPRLGLEKLVRSINTYLEAEKTAAKKKMEDEQRRLEELERQRRLQEEEKKRQERIEKLETAIAAEESRRIELKKAVVLKEKELALAQVDLKAFENKIQRLQNQMQELKNPRQKPEEIAKPIVVEEKKQEEGNKGSSKNKTFNVNNVEFTMIYVGGGDMGDFYIGETQVTQALWEAVMGNNPSYFKGSDHPVEQVSWKDCKEFIGKLNILTGQNFRLPRDTEWEYAAQKGMYYYGEWASLNELDKYAWFNRNSCGITHIVKKRKPNELGIYDMIGNVWEWCEESYYGKSNLRILRGGSWDSNENECRVSHRSFSSSNNRSIRTGFRLALNVRQS